MRMPRGGPNFNGSFLTIQGKDVLFAASKRVVEVVLKRKLQI